MRLTLLLAFCACLLLLACDPEREFVTGDAVQLRFERDTLSFDTVFTARGSATLRMKVYNDQAAPVQIDRIFVEGTTGVTFTFNADGTQGPETEDVVIWGNDSIFVLVEAEVDPSSPPDRSPFIAEDKLVFELGNFREEVVLQAFGQNAVYLNGFRRAVFFQPICASGTFTLPNDLPVVIYGSMIIDSCVVRALAGTELYFYGGFQRNEFAPDGFTDGFIVTLANGSLELLGTLEEPIVLATDRLEEGFEEVAGAYRGLIFGPESTGNRIAYTTINNAFVGVQVDSSAEVSLDNVTIANTTGPALFVDQARVRVTNSLFHSNFQNTVQVINGGDLEFDHCTFASYNGSEAVALALTNFEVRDNEVVGVGPLRARVRNSILGGFDANELLLSDIFRGDEPAAFDVQIANSVVRTDQEFVDFVQDSLRLTDFYGSVCQNCHNLAFEDPLFVSVRDDDYHLDSLSVARDLGEFLPASPQDLEGNARDTETPDAGALEWQPGG